MAPLLVSTVIGLALLASRNATRQGEQMRESVREIQQSLADLSSLSQTYLLYQEQRPVEQFFQEYRRLMSLLDRSPALPGDESTSLTHIRENAELMRQSFQRLSQVQRDYASVGYDSLLAEAQHRLTSRMQIQIRDATSEAIRLKRLISMRIESTHSRTNLLTFVLLAGMTLPVTIVLLRLMRKTSQSLATLHQGTLRVAKGDLSFRIQSRGKDEIAELAAAFDAMTGQLEQTTVSLETRLNITFSPDLTLELFAQPFLASGDFGALKELRAPGTFEFDRYGVDQGTVEMDEEGDLTIDPDGSGPAESIGLDDPDFNRVSLRGTAVVRWEWRPGSTLFLVWQQSRSDSYEDGRFDLTRDADAMWGARADNVFMVKATYWIGR